MTPLHLTANKSTPTQRNKMPVTIPAADPTAAGPVSLAAQASPAGQAAAGRSATRRRADGRGGGRRATGQQTQRAAERRGGRGLLAGDGHGDRSKRQGSAGRASGPWWRKRAGERASDRASGVEALGMRWAAGVGGCRCRCRAARASGSACRAAARTASIHARHAHHIAIRNFLDAATAAACTLLPATAATSSPQSGRACRIPLQWHQ